MVLRAGPYQWMSLWAILLVSLAMCAGYVCGMSERESGVGRRMRGGEGGEREGEEIWKPE